MQILGEKDGSGCTVGLPAARQQSGRQAFWTLGALPAFTGDYHRRQCGLGKAWSLRMQTQHIDRTRRKHLREMRACIMDCMSHRNNIVRMLNAVSRIARSGEDYGFTGGRELAGPADRNSR